MSANKLKRSIKRHHDSRVTVKQLDIWRMYNTSDTWLASQKPSGFRKRKAMNCSCRTCRGWADDAKRSRLTYQLEKHGMKEERDLGLVIDHGVGEGITREEYDGRCTVHLREEEWV